MERFLETLLENFQKRVERLLDAAPTRSSCEVGTFGNVGSFARPRSGSKKLLHNFGTSVLLEHCGIELMAEEGKVPTKGVSSKCPVGYCDWPAGSLIWGRHFCHEQKPRTQWRRTREVGRRYPARTARTSQGTWRARSCQNDAATREEDAKAHRTRTRGIEAKRQ
jgi:hypothetical protein